MVMVCALLQAIPSFSAEFQFVYSGEPLPSDAMGHGYTSSGNFINYIKCNIVMSGEIGPGDALRFTRLYKKHYVDELARDLGDAQNMPPNSFLPVRIQHNVTLCMNSTGGDLEEALKLASKISERSVSTVVKKKCLSACALAFMFGKFDVLIGSPRGGQTSRYMHATSELGFHAPFFNAAMSDQLVPMHIIEQMYVRAIYDFSLIVQLSENLSSSDGPALASDLLLRIASTPHNDFEYVDRVEEAIGWGISVFGPNHDVSVSRKSALIACNNLAEKYGSFDGATRRHRFQDVRQITLSEIYVSLGSNPDISTDRLMRLDSDQIFGIIQEPWEGGNCIVSKNLILFGNTFFPFSPLLLAEPGDKISDLGN